MPLAESACLPVKFSLKLGHMPKLIPYNNLTGKSISHQELCIVYSKLVLTSWIYFSLWKQFWKKKGTPPKNKKSLEKVKVLQQLITATEQDSPECQRNQAWFRLPPVATAKILSGMAAMHWQLAKLRIEMKLHTSFLFCILMYLRYLTHQGELSL